MNIKCPKCYSLGENKKEGYLVTCFSNACKQNITQFCFECREILQQAEIKDHFENGSVYLGCIKKNLQCRFCYEKKAKKNDICEKITEGSNCWRLFCLECQQEINFNDRITHGLKDCSNKQQQQAPKSLKFYF